MSLSILSNIASLDAQRNLSRTQAALQRNIAHLASGERIVDASDDAAGLGISDKLRAQIRSLVVDGRNASDGISLAQIADGALNEVTSLVSRLRELAVQSANGTLDTTSRSFLQTEFSQLQSEIDRISAVTQYNGQNIIDGTFSNGVNLQVGFNSSTNDVIALSIGNTDTSTLGVSAGTSVGDISSAQAALSAIDAALTSIAGRRANIGAIESRLNAAISNINTARQQLAAADSRIRDVDVASETADLTRNQILSQAGVAVLAQANQLPASALSLLSGR